MGLIFDLLLLLYIALSVYHGYKRGFLLSISGVVALVVSILIYKIFDLEYVYFGIMYIVLLIAVGFLAKLIRNFKIPIIARTDAILGTLFGALNGIAGAFIIAVLVLLLSKAGRFDGIESSFVLRMIEGILPI